MTDKLMQAVNGLAATIKLYEINGEMDGFDGRDIEQGWEEIASQLRARGLQVDYNMKPFYENGWYVGYQRRTEKASETPKSE